MTGLSAIPPVRDGIIIRPLIETGRKEILEYLDYQNLEFAIDSSNLNKKHLRNRIRLELIPELIKYQPNLIENFGRLSAYLREENEYINLQAEKWVEAESKTDQHDCLYIKLPVLNRLPRSFAGRALRIIISKFITYLHGVDAVHIDAIFDLIENQKPNVFIQLPKGLIVKKEYDNLVFSLDEDQLKPFHYIIRDPGTINIEETGQRISIEKIDKQESEPVEKSNTDTALIDGDKAKFPLTLRNFLPGDRFIPLGMNGRKKVKNFFIDLKVPLGDRKLAPILLCDDKIVCICGHRIDNRFKVTPNTKTVLKCQLLQPDIKPDVVE
jgi:tRNA(Ile)-lysidine synthase